MLLRRRWPTTKESKALRQGLPLRLYSLLPTGRPDARSCYRMLRNNAPGPEIGFWGRMSAGFQSGMPQNRLFWPTWRLPLLRTGRNPARKPHLRPESILEQHRVHTTKRHSKTTKPQVSTMCFSVLVVKAAVIIVRLVPVRSGDFGHTRTDPSFPIPRYD